jgi:tetratricopeptide (TPR) repeat protein
LGEILAKQGKPAEAVTYLRAALAANPNYKDALYELGSAEIALGHPKDAVAPLRKVISLYPEFYKAHFVLGTALRQLGQEEEGLREQKLSAQMQKRADENSAKQINDKAKSKE